MKNAEDKPKVPTLLELALPRKKKPPSTSHSDDSEQDILLGEKNMKPPQTSTQKDAQASKALAQKITGPSPNTKRKTFRSKKYEKINQGDIKREADKTDASNSATSGRKAQPFDNTSAYGRFLHPQSNMTNITGSSGIYSASNRQFGSDLSKDNNQSSEIEKKTRNYHIKVIRRGIPEIVSTDFKGRTIPIAPQEVEVNAYCVCQSSSSKKRNVLAWMFTVVAVFVCIICPLLSFSADVTFFIICSEHYDDTKKLLDGVQEQSRQTAIATYAAPKDSTIAEKPSITEQYKPAPHLAAPEKPLLAEQPRSSDLQPLYEKSIVNIRHKRTEVLPSPTTNATPTDSFTYTSLPVQPASSLPVVRSFNPLLYTDITNCKIPIYERKPVCNNVSVVLEYMASPDAAIQLEAHRHVTSDIFEPVFIIGSFPSLILCILTRLVVMVSKHDHFLSAYVINMASMPLQLITGALAVHSASYHIGPNGFECWKCAFDGNCSDIGPLEWLKDEVSVSLIVATIAKLIDGAAGGCILFVVLLRVIWIKRGHVSCWWYAGRMVISLASLSFCITVSSTMVLTPSVGVFRLEMMNVTAYFDGKENVCYVSMILLGMGLTAWGVSFLTLFIYLLYRTYVYCRIKEHVSGVVSL